MNVKLSPSHARGDVQAPPSKSMAHRLLIAAAMANGDSVLSGVSTCQDVQATMDCLRALGVECRMHEDRVTVKGGSIAACSVTDVPPVLPCRESGSTMRFLLPIALLRNQTITLTGAQSLLRRPMTVYEQLCREHNCLFIQTENGITVRGRLTPGDYVLAGNISSQFVSGMLFALTQVGGRSVLRLLPPVESRSYILLTIDALRTFGAEVEWLDETTLIVEGGRSMQACHCAVEGDYSNAAFLDAFNLFGGEVRIDGLRTDSLQGDRIYTQCFSDLEKRIPISLEDCPDLAPILFAVAAARNGGIFTGTKRLKIKESDRAEVMAQELRKFGTRVTVSENSVRIHADTFRTPCEVLYGHNDHRIVMALAVLASLTGGTIRGAEAVDKSFPNFFDCLRSLGIAVEEV